MNYRIAAVVTLLIVATGIAVAVANARLVPKVAVSAPPLSMISVGDAAPPFRVTTIDGAALDSTTIDRPIVLEVFATWCPHCQRETAVLDRLWQADGARDALVGVSGSPYAMDRSTPSSLADVERFAELLGVRYPIAYDESLDVAKNYLQGGYPTIVFIDRNKKVVAIESGEVSFDRLRADLRKAGDSHA